MINNFNYLYRKNKKLNGILLINKPSGKTSHDIVNQVRKIIKQKSVGHAGTLDPFASGLLIILVGEKTRCFNEFLKFDKDYEFDLIFGASTDTCDLDGSIKLISEIKDKDGEKIKKAIKELEKCKFQFPPIFSSVKFEGVPLRKFARMYSLIKVEDGSKFRKISLKMIKNGEEIIKELKIKRRNVQISNVKLKSFRFIKSFSKDEFFINQKLFYAKITATVSSGTYIREFTNFFYKKIGVPSFVSYLKRTRIGEFKLKDAVCVKDIEKKFKFTNLI